MSEPTESTVQVTGELTEFPGFLKLPGEVQSLVVADRSIEEIFRLTISSHVGCQIIRNAKLKACHVEIDQENHEIRVQIMSRKWIIWRFRKSSRVLTTMSLRDMMLAARERGGEWCTLCTDPRTAMREAFDHMKHLFGIHEIRKARLRITDARQYYHGFKILERIRRLRYLDLHTELPIEEEKLKAVLDLGPFVYLKISYPEHIAFQYSKPLPYATRLSINNSVTNWFSKQHFRNLQCSYLCWTDNSSSAGIIMNTIFRRWKAGGFPEMRIIECEELARVPDIGEVVGGLGAEKVGERRVQIFNRALPFIAKQLITFKTQQLDISGAVDFTRTTDGTIATVIPLRGSINRKSETVNSSERVQTSKTSDIELISETTVPARTQRKFVDLQLYSNPGSTVILTINLKFSILELKKRSTIGAAKREERMKQQEAPMEFRKQTRRTPRKVPNRAPARRFWNRGKVS